MTEHRWLVLPVILLATFMASFDYMVVNVAIPVLRTELHAGQAALELVVGGYAFTYAAGMVSGGKLGDLYGHRRMFLLGVAAFALASLLCGLAATAVQLVGARLLQGLAAAAMAPQVLALITAILPAGERSRGLSWFGVVLGTGGIAGQVCGGPLIQADLFGFGWRAIFLINVPIGVVAVLAAAKLLPVARPTARPRLDLLGVLGISAAVALALVPLALGREAGWPAWTWASLAASPVVLGFTLGWERRAPEPLIDPALFRARSFSAGLGIMVAFMATMGGLMFVMTLLLQVELGLSTLAAGLTFLPMAVGSMVTSLLGRGLFARYGLRALAAGGVMSTAGMLAFAVELHLLGKAVGPGWLSVPLALFGLGAGLVVPSLMGVVLGGIEPARAGIAAGVLTTGQQFAGAMGVAVLGAVSSPEEAMWICAVLMAVATGLVALLRAREGSAQHQVADELQRRLVAGAHDQQAGNG
ncbi:MFS transporter [Nonomuraea sp. H19]|uniref:MFS transporter n=1 Tax=Nonomuraea sp. H19 TaxID=3452206 RepID=UPI003F8CEAA2